MSKFINRKGEIYQMKNGQNLEIIEYFNADNISVKFQDSTILEKQTFDQVKKKTLNNPNYPILYDFGFVGIGKHFASDGIKPTKKYAIWAEMLRRVKSHKYHEKHPAYIGTAVYKIWGNFQIFGDWFDDNWIDGFVLDKDIIVKGNRAYHPLRCCFVPQEINNLFVKKKKKENNLPIGVIHGRNGMYHGKFNVSSDKTIYSASTPSTEEAFQFYKENKERKICILAEKWKGKISENVYNAMLSYKVEITD
jgi:hypothetical protein